MNLTMAQSHSINHFVRPSSYLHKRRVNLLLIIYPAHGFEEFAFVKN